MKKILLLIMAIAFSNYTHTMESSEEESTQSETSQESGQEASTPISKNKYQSKIKSIIQNMLSKTKSAKNLEKKDTNSSNTNSSSSKLSLNPSYSSEEIAEYINEFNSILDYLENNKFIGKSDRLNLSNKKYDKDLAEKIINTIKYNLNSFKTILAKQSESAENSDNIVVEIALNTIKEIKRKIGQTDFLQILNSFKELLIWLQSKGYNLQNFLNSLRNEAIQTPNDLRRELFDLGQIIDGKKVKINYAKDKINKLLNAINNGQTNLD